MASLNDGGISGFQVTQDNTREVLEALENSVEKALTEIGIKAEKYAKENCPVGSEKTTGIKGYIGGTLKRSITFEVESDEDGGTVTIGSNVEYAPYVELGTGTEFEPPPEWEQFEAKRGSGLGRGIRARKFLRRAIEDHLNLYRKIVEDNLKK